MPDGPRCARRSGAHLVQVRLLSPARARRQGPGLPFQCKTSVRTFCDAVPQAEEQNSPTAHAAPPGAAATPLMPAAWYDPGTGVRDHARPFQCRISGTSAAEAVPQPELHE
jgi:hypothetical protein